MATEQTEGKTTHEPDTFTTYKMANGEPVAGEYGWVSDTEFFEDALDWGGDSVEVIREVWTRQSMTPITFHPETCASCEQPWHGDGCTDEPEDAE